MEAQESEPIPVDTDPAEAVRRLADLYGGQIFALGMRFCGDATDAEDLVQDVFLQAFRGWAKFEGRSNPKTWLYTIAARTCQRMHRKRAGEPKQIGSLDELLPFGDPLIAVIASEQEDAVQIEIRKEAREQIERAIASLPVEFRVPLILKDIVGFTVPEVSRVLGIEEGTIRSRVHRARLKLRAHVDGVIPRSREEAPPPAYSKQVCLDLLAAKQDALDRGVSFDSEIICDRCRSVFASLDLTQDVCRDLANNRLSDDLRRRIVASIAGDAA